MGQEYYNIGLAHPKLLLPYTEWATMRDEGKKIAKLENIVLLHACNFRWAKNITLSYETGIFWPDMKMLKVHQNAPTSMLKSQFFPGVIPRTPESKGEGREGGVGWGWEGRE
jgi:hypothetical protein